MNDLCSFPAQLFSLDGTAPGKYNSHIMYLILAICSSAALTLVLKWFRNPKGTRYGIVLGNYLTCTLTAFLQMPAKGRFYVVSPSTLLMSCISGFLFLAGLLCMQSSVRINGATLTSAFSRLGMLIPLLAGFLFFGEVPAPLQVAGLLFAVSAIIVLNLPEKTENDHETGQTRVTLWLLLLTLLACGSSDGMSKVFERLGDHSEDTRYFFFLFLTASLLTGALSVEEKKRTGKAIRFSELAAGVLAGIPNYFSSYFLLKALIRLPAMLVYPVFSVGTILLVMGAGALFFKERLGRRQWIGLVMILIALVLLNL